MNNAVINDARVIPKGQVTIPKNICAILGIAPGDRVTFVAENDSVRGVNFALYAMQKFQEEMKGSAASTGFASEDEIAGWITNSRREEIQS